MYYVVPIPEAFANDIVDGIVSMDYKFYEVECVDRFLSMKAEEAKRGAYPKHGSKYVVAAFSYFVVVASSATEWEKGQIASRFRQHLCSKPVFHKFVCQYRYL